MIIPALITIFEIALQLRHQTPPPRNLIKKAAGN